MAGFDTIFFKMLFISCLQVAACDIDLLPQFLPALKAMFAEEYAEMEVKSMKKIRKKGNNSNGGNKTQNLSKSVQGRSKRDQTPPSVNKQMQSTQDVKVNVAEHKNVTISQPNQYCNLEISQPEQASTFIETSHPGRDSASIAVHQDQDCTIQTDNTEKQCAITQKS